MKRLLLIFLAALLLAACGGGQPAGDNAGPLANVDGPAFVYFYTDN